jgi:hypothetical protein
MTWKNISGKEGFHYSIMRREEGSSAIELLRELFPDGEANELNFCLFSTSGVHGLYNTIEEAEQSFTDEEEDSTNCVTFLVVHPRTVSLRYGNCYPETREDFQFLKKLRETSHKAVAGIGFES